MERLTTGGEKLLQEILNHCNDNGLPDSNYWEQRFENLSSAEDALLRSQFEELEAKDMINVSLWADAYPYYMEIKNNGMTYQKEMRLQEKQIRSEKRKEYAWTLITAIITTVIGFLLGKYFG